MIRMMFVPGPHSPEAGPLVFLFEHVITLRRGYSKAAPPVDRADRTKSKRSGKTARTMPSPSGGIVPVEKSSAKTWSPAGNPAGASHLKTVLNN
jgi:hypothetical protein